jgi:hypothetical protein
MAAGHRSRLSGDLPLPGLEGQVRKRQEGSSAQDSDYPGLLKFCRAVVACGELKMDWETEDEEYSLSVPEPGES